MEICNKCKGNQIKVERTFKYHDVFYCKDCHYWTYRAIDDCCRKPNKIIVIDRKNYDHYFIREQCIECGGCINKAKPLSRKLYGHLIRSELSELSAQSRWDELHNEKEYIISLKNEYNELNSPWYKYSQYLSSDEWKDKRKLVHDRDNNICQKCKVEPSSDIHHITYKNIYNEPLEDLIAICRKCHEEEHSNPSKEILIQGDK